MVEQYDMAIIGPMPLQQRFFFTTAALLFFIGIIYLVKRRKLLEEYSLMWLLIGLGILVYSNSYYLISNFSRFIGVSNPVSTVFYFTFVLLLLICMQISIHMSFRYRQHKNFAQKFAIMEYELNAANFPEKKSDTLVIIPCHNEEQNIEHLIKDIINNGKDLDILVVNDDSTDQTESIVKMTGVNIISHPVNLKYGVALQTGYRFAYKHGYQTVVQLDGDGQHHPESIGNILEPVLNNEADFVVGSRFQDESNYDVSFMRVIGMRLFSRINKFITGNEITDTTSGFQAFNRKVLSFFITDDFPTDFPDADILIMLHYRNLRIQERSVKMSENKQGKSMHQGFINPLYYIFKMFLSIFVLLIRFGSFSKKSKTRH